MTPPEVPPPPETPPPPEEVAHKSAAVEVFDAAGDCVTPYIDDVAKLRIAVFREWPYLYDGDMAYEREYLAALTRSAGSVTVLARVDGRIVGASTAMPMTDEHGGFKQPFAEAGIEKRNE